jgi:hypothetical protein
MSDNNRNQQNQHQDQGGDFGNQGDQSNLANQDQQSSRNQGSPMDHQGTTHTQSQKGSDLGKEPDQTRGGVSSDSSGKEDVNIADT